MDMRWYPTEEATMLQALEAQERDLAARQLEGTLNQAQDENGVDRQQAVSFGGTTYHGGSPSPAQKAGRSDGDTGGAAQTGPSKPSSSRPGAKGNLIGVMPDPSGDPAPPTEVWYCMTRPNTQRVATHSSDTMFQWQTEGARLVWIAQTREEAAAWVSAWTPPNPGRAPRREPTVQRAPVTLPSARVDPNQWSLDPTGVPFTPDEPPQDPRLSLLDKASRFSVGPDPSVGTSLIFGIDPADVDKMDDLLLPPQVGDVEARQEFYDLAMDVASLPGGYRVTDDDDYGSTELLARAFGKTRSAPYRNWRKVTANALSRVGSRKELMQFVSDVEKAVVRHRKAQEHRMRTFLLACRLPSDVVALYLRSGLLPRVIQETYTFYIRLLETLRSAQWEISSPVWKDSYVDHMVRHHASEMGQIRLTASDYRMHLLETYVYLRNAHKDKYQDPSFTRHLLYSVARGPSGDSEDQTGSGGKDNSSGTPRCQHCRRNGLHSGQTKDDCPLKALSARKAQQAVANLNKKQAKAVMKAIKDKLSDTPNANIDSVIEDARSGV